MTEGQVSLIMLKNGQKFVASIADATETHLSILHPLVVHAADANGIQMKEWLWEAGDKGIEISFDDLLFLPKAVNPPVNEAYWAYIDGYYDTEEEAEETLDESVPEAVTLH